MYDERLDEAVDELKEKIKSTSKFIDISTFIYDASVFVGTFITTNKVIKKVAPTNSIVMTIARWSMSGYTATKVTETMGMHDKWKEIVNGGNTNAGKDDSVVEGVFTEK